MKRNELTVGLYVGLVMGSEYQWFLYLCLGQIAETWYIRKSRERLLIQILHAMLRQVGIIQSSVHENRPFMPPFAQTSFSST